MPLRPGVLLALFLLPLSLLAQTTRPTTAPTTAPGTGNGSAPALSTGTPPALRIVTYNILRNGTRGPQAILDTLKPLHADVICLQESYNPLNAPYYGSRLGMTSWSTSPAGQAILSRLPTQYLGVVPGFENNLGTDALWADITLPDNTKVRVACVHLQTVTPKSLAGLLQTEPLRAQQITKLHTAWERVGKPTLLIAGDFNQLPATPNYHAMTTHFQDALATLSQTGPTFEQGVRIDYILHTPNLTALAGGVIQSKASDHYPIWAHFAPTPKATTQPSP